MSTSLGIQLISTELSVSEVGMHDVAGLLLLIGIVGLLVCSAIRAARIK